MTSRSDSGSAEPEAIDGAYIIKPVYKTLQLLKTIGEAGHPLSLSEVCALTRLPKSTAFKYLRTLRECGFLSHDPVTDTYQVGIAVWQLGRLSGSVQVVRDSAAPLMRRLGERFDETVSLGVLDGTEVVYVEIVDSTRALQSRARLGGTEPAYASAVGQAVLAFLPANRWRGHVPAQRAARSDLDDELSQTRKRGYAVDRGHGGSGIVTLAAPVFDAGGAAVAAIGLSAPTSRLPKRREREVASELVTTANRCSELLGHPGTR